MFIKFKKMNPNATAPKRAHSDDAGYDLVAVSREINSDYIEYDTGIAVEIPHGHVGLMFPRSSISKVDLVLCNSVGVIDSGFRGSIKARFRPTAGSPWDARSYQVGDKVVQLVIVELPIVAFEEGELEDSKRGQGGFGSTGV